MSVATDVYRHVKATFFNGDGAEEYFLPVANSYPHLHVNKDYCGFSRKSQGSNTVVNGDDIYWGVLDGLLQEPGLNPGIQNVLQYVDNTYQR